MSIPDRRGGRAFTRAQARDILARFECGESIMALALAFDSLMAPIEDVVRRAFKLHERDRSQGI